MKKTLEDQGATRAVFPLPLKYKIKNRGNKKTRKLELLWELNQIHAQTAPPPLKNTLALPMKGLHYLFIVIFLVLKNPSWFSAPLKKYSSSAHERLTLHEKKLQPQSLHGVLILSVLKLNLNRRCATKHAAHNHSLRRYTPTSSGDHGEQPRMILPLRNANNQQQC